MFAYILNFLKRPSQKQSTDTLTATKRKKSVMMATAYFKVSTPAQLQRQ